MFSNLISRWKTFFHLRTKNQHFDIINDREAAAALLFHVIAIDGTIDPMEEKRLHQLLRQEYDLDHNETDDLIVRARQLDMEAVDLYTFTRVLTRKLDQDGRKRVIAMLWSMVYADNGVHEFEGNLVWRVSELLGVSARDRITLKKEAERHANG